MANYRGINPVKTFEAPHHPLSRPQFSWHSPSANSAHALFAGKEMSIYINDDDKTFELIYLDFAHPKKFNSIEEAKNEASDFARAVLLRMLECVGVRFEDKSLRDCLNYRGQ